MTSTAQLEMNLRMPPDGSARLAALEAWGRTLDAAARAYAEEVRQAAGDALGVMKQYRDGWQSLVDEALAGRAIQAHAERDRFLQAVEQWHRLLVHARDRAAHATEVARCDLPETSHLESEAAVLEKALKKLQSRWHTAEDLEYLAAESLTPSREKLEAVERKCGFPQAWYDDDSVPF